MRRPPLRLLVLACLAVALRQAGAQSQPWSATPPRPTVGDTVWLDRVIDAPAGWRVRPGKLTIAEDVEPLGDALVLRTTQAWVVRYPVVAWSPGRHEVSLPPIWRLAPDGRADSLPGGVAPLVVQNVIPDSLRQPEPKSAIAPLRADQRRPLLPWAALTIALALGAGAVLWRWRAPRPLESRAQVPVEREVPDARWLAAGEPKAVAARAAGRVRAAIARAARHPVPALAEVLEQLEQVEFVAHPDVDVAAIVSRARALAPASPSPERKP